MTVSIYMVAILAALLLAPPTALGQAPEDCAVDGVEGKHYCKDCLNGVVCGATGEPTPYVTCTKPGEVCAIEVATSTCVPLADSPCSCDKPQQCDAYNDGAQLVCLNGGGTIIISECPAATPTCSDGLCTVTTVPEDPCEGSTVAGFVLIKPECTSAAYCQTNGTSAGTVDCDAGEYFDPEITDCATSPPVPCAGGCKGACPDKTDCKRYYVCNGGVVEDPQDCEDPTKPYFDPVSKTCQTDETKCTPTDGCEFSETGGPGSTTTTTGATTTTTGTTTAGTTTAGTTTAAPLPPCTAATEHDRYPYEGNCKKYWECTLLDANGHYGYQERTCFDIYVFNPVTMECDVPENVPGCVPPSFPWVPRRRET